MSVDHTKNIIELKNITFGYTDQPVLESVSLNVHQGDYLGIIGPNGGGKTTILRIMLGLIKPTSGFVTLFDKPIDEFKDWSRIGYVPQKATQFDSNFPLTVEEVVVMGRYGRRGILHSITEEDRHIVHTALEQVEMHEYKDRIIGDLSGGQQQRVFIARAIAMQPEVILLDEPTVGVDMNAQGAFYKLLKKLNHDMGLTLVLVSHDIDVVTHEVTELACINRTLIYDDNPRDFIKSEGLKKLYGNHMKLILHTH